MGGLAWGGKEILTMVMICMLVKTEFDIKKDRFLSQPVKARHVQPLRQCFQCGEGRDNFFGHIGDKLYAKVNFLKIALRDEGQIEIVIK